MQSRLQIVLHAAEQAREERLQDYDDTAVPIKSPVHMKSKQSCAPEVEMDDAAILAEEAAARAENIALANELERDEQVCRLFLCCMDCFLVSSREGLGVFKLVQSVGQVIERCSC